MIPVDDIEIGPVMLILSGESMNSATILHETGGRPPVAREFEPYHAGRNARCTIASRGASERSATRLH